MAWVPKDSNPVSLIKDLFWVAQIEQMIRQKLRELYEIEPQNSTPVEEPDEEVTNNYVRSVVQELDASRKELLNIQKRELDQIKAIIDKVDKDVLYAQ